MASLDWPFDQQPNCAVISLCSIVFRGAPILHVTHDADDHGWQFLGAERATMKEATVIALQEVVDLDPTVLEIADIPPGWHAWRASAASSWSRGPSPPSN
jgi:hypothetical protein